MSRHELNQWHGLNHEVNTFVDNAVDVQYMHCLFVPQTCRSDDERWGHGIHGSMFAAFLVALFLSDIGDCRFGNGHEGCRVRYIRLYDPRWERLGHKLV